MSAVGVAWVMTSSVFAANVAKIGDTEYATIDAAIAAWKPGEMIELLSDIERDSYFVFTQNTYALDGKGHTIKCTKAHSTSWKYFVNANAGTQTFKNIIIDGNGKVPFVMQAIDGGKLILENVTIKGAKTTTTGSLFSRSTSLGYGIHVNDGSVEAKNITITNCEVADVYQDGASSSFTLSGDNCNVNFIGSSSAKESVTSTAKGYYAYEVTYKSNLGNGMAKTISNKSLNGIIDQVQKSITTIVASFPMSVEIKSATVKLLQDVVFAEVFTSNDTKLTIDGNGKKVTGTFKFGANPSPVSNAVLGDGSVLDCTASVKTGFSGVSVAADANIEILLPASADINSYSLPVALGTGAIANITVGDKKYIAKGDTIAPAEMLAQVGDTRYATLQEAIDAANGMTVHVLKDVELASSLTVPAGKTLTLNLAGRKITVSGRDYALVNNGTLTVIDMNLVSVMAAESALDGEEAKSFLITGVSANDGLSALDGAAGGSIAGVQNKGTFALESGSVVASSANVPAIDNAANAVATITGGTVEGKLQSADKDALTITGGSFTGESNVAEFVGGNYGVDSNGTVISYVAQLGETKYQTLQEAFAAAREFDVVTVIDDAADVSDIAGFVAQGLFPISNGDKTYTLRAMPAATVEKLPAFTLTAERDGYACWPSGDTTTDRPLDIVMNFLANDDGKAEANESGFADWKCDFYLTFSDMAGDSLVADECYLAGNYGGFGWIVIPADDTIIDNNATLPVVAAYDANITYRQVCDTVKKFTAAIHVADAVMTANPDLKITLQLKMTNNKDASQELVVGSYTYGVDDLKGMYNPEVKVAENVAVDDVFKATVGSALADAYQTAEGKLGVTVKEKGATFATIDVAAKDDYEIPEEGLEMTFPAASVADGGTAFIVHRHNGVLYVYSGVVEYGFVTYKNTLGFSEFTVGDAAALNAAIAKAEAGDTIKLMSDIALSLPIYINNNVVIDGNGHKITPASDFTADGHNAVIVFAPAASDYSASRNYSIKNLTVEGFSGLVRVLRANFCDSLVENCAFVDNSVSEGVITSSFGKTNVKGCTFEGNTSGFSIVSVGYDVSAGTELSVAIEDSKFTGNKAAIALVYAASSVVVTGNFFSGNTHSGDNANAAAVLAGPYTGKMNYTIGITENAFVDAFGKDGGEALPDVFAEDWSEQYGVSTSFDLSSNYWNGGEPNYAVSGKPSIDLTDYYTTYADGVKDGLTEVKVAVAKIGETTYATLVDALAAAQTGDTVVLLADATGDVTVAEGCEVVIDLNGNDIVGTLNAIVNNGTLTINDTVGTGNVYTTDVSAQGRAAIVNRGTIVINGGWFGDANNDTSDRNAINRGNALKNYGTAIVNGGYFTNVSNQYIGSDAYAYAINTLAGGTTVINEATVYGDVNGLIYSAGKTTVNGGSFTLGRPGEENNLWYLAYGDVMIKGGTWVRAFKVPSWNTSDPKFNGNVVVSGGDFNIEIPETYRAEGCNSVKQPGEELWQVGKLPNAEVVNMGPTEITEYKIFNGSGLVTGPATPINLQVALEFIAKDTPAQAAENAYGQYITDFYITIDGAAEGSFTADGCYLAGNYGAFGWIMIPLDEMVIKNGVVHPVITSAFAGNFEFTYENICSSVKDFKCGIYFSPKVLAANPGLSVSLDLGLSETIEKAQNAEFTSAVEKPFVYDVQDMTSAVAISGPDYFTTVTGAVAAALETGGSVKLVDNAGLEDRLEIDRDLVFNLGGNTLTVNGKMLAITDAVVTITNGTLSGFSAANITLTGNAILTVTDKNVADSFRTSDSHYVSQNANGTHSIMLKSTFRVFITMVDGEPRIGFFKDCDTERAPTAYAIKGATNLETPEWADVDYETATDAAAASELPLHWVRPVGSSAQSGIRFFKLSAE